MKSLTVAHTLSGVPVPVSAGNANCSASEADIVGTSHDLQ